jgi:uncharacterized protein (DUF433 family)
MARLNVELPEFLRQYHDEVRLVGHRIGLYDIVRRYQSGSREDVLAHDFPTLSPLLIQKVIAFYLEHQQVVDEYVASYSEVLREQEARNPTRVTAQMLRERLAKKKAAEQATANVE